MKTPIRAIWIERTVHTNMPTETRIVVWRGGELKTFYHGGYWRNPVSKHSVQRARRAFKALKLAQTKSKGGDA